MENKDWTGNKNSIFKTLGASNHTDKERQKEDFYATEPKAATLLLELETFSDNIWECACGDGSLSKVLEDAGYNVKNTDLIDRGFGQGGVDFLKTRTQWDGDIITNPPYKYGKEFVEKALEIIPEGRKVAMFLKLQFLEGKERKKLFLRYPPKVVYVSSSRLLCAKNSKFGEIHSSAVAYGWYVWEKGFNGKTTLQWFN
jgi:hypothetical protein